MQVRALRPEEQARGPTERCNTDMDGQSTASTTLDLACTGRRSITMLELGLAKARKDCVHGDGASSSGTSPPSAILPGEGETFDSRPPTPQSPSYSPEASDDETPLSTHERALQLAATAERLLQEILSSTAPSFDTIFNWTEFFLLGNYAYKGVDVHAVERIVEHFVLIVPTESETPPGSSTEHGHSQAEPIQ